MCVARNTCVLDLERDALNRDIRDCSMRHRSGGVFAAVRNSPHGHKFDRDFFCCATTRARRQTIPSEQSIRFVYQERLSPVSGVRVSLSPTPPQQPAPLVVRVDAAGVSKPATDALPANNWNPGSTVDCWPPERTDGHSPSADKIAVEIEISAAQGN